MIMKKKPIKRIWSILLILCMTLSCLPVHVQAASASTPTVNGTQIFANGSTYVHFKGGTTECLYGAGFSGKSDISGTINIYWTSGTVKKVMTGVANSSTNLYSGRKNGFFYYPPNEFGTVYDGVKSFDNLVYKNGSSWIVKGNAAVPEGYTLPIESGQTLTIS